MDEAPVAERSREEALPLVEVLAEHVGYFKVGLELLTREGAPNVVRQIHALGGKLFFDAKFSDIPNTVGKASKATGDLGVSFFDVHASCGVEAMRSAVANKGTSKVLAVTILTSLDETSAEHIFGATPMEKVIQFARDARSAME